MTNRVLRAVLCVFALGFFLASSQEMNEGPLLEVAESEEYGPYLTDAEGRALYLFFNDQQEDPYEGIYPSTCYEQCAENWPPFIVETWSPPEEGEESSVSVGEGVDETLLNAIEREGEDTEGEGEGTPFQLAYGDWPLYYFAGDENPGDINGQGRGDVWFLVSPEGEAIVPEGVTPGGVAEDEEAEGADDADDAEGEDDAEGGEGEGENGEGQEDEGGEAEGNGGNEDQLFAELMSEGERVFTQTASPPCASCHGEQGEGGAGPELAGSNVAENAGRIIRLIVHGTNFMPGFGEQLSDRQIAAVATFVRNSWGNDFALVTEEEVSEER